MYQPLLVNFYGLVEKKLIFLDHFIISRLIFLPFYMLFHVMPSRVLSTKASVQVSFNWHNLVAKPPQLSTQEPNTTYPENCSFKHNTTIYCIHNTVSQKKLKRSY